MVVTKRALALKTQASWLGTLRVVVDLVYALAAMTTSFRFGATAPITASVAAF